MKNWPRKLESIHASEHDKDKRKVANAWKRVDEKLGFEEGNTSIKTCVHCPMSVYRSKKYE